LIFETLWLFGQFFTVINFSSSACHDFPLVFAMTVFIIVQPPFKNIIRLSLVAMRFNLASFFTKLASFNVAMHYVTQ